MTAEQIGFSILSYLHIGPEMVSGYFIFRFNRIYIEHLDARGIAAVKE